MIRLKSFLFAATLFLSTEDLVSPFYQDECQPAFNPLQFAQMGNLDDINRINCGPNVWLEAAVCVRGQAGYRWASQDRSDFRCLQFTGGAGHRPLEGRQETRNWPPNIH